MGQIIFKIFFMSRYTRYLLHSKKMVTKFDDLFYFKSIWFLTRIELKQLPENEDDRNIIIIIIIIIIHSVNQIESHQLEIVDVHQNWTQHLPERQTLSNFNLLGYRFILKCVADWCVCISDMHAVSSFCYCHILFHFYERKM